MIQQERQAGFTLIEIAIALVIVAVLLGYTVAMFPLQQELKQYRSAEDEMDLIVEHLIGFAQVNGRLPCPDTSGDINGTGANPIDGIEDTDGNGCKAFFGFLPGRTLGMNGDYDPDGVILDPWSVGYGYAVSDVDTSGDGSIDLVTANNVRDEGFTNVIPDLVICNDSTVDGNQDNCDAAFGGPGADVIDGVAVVIVSLGRENNIPAGSTIQDENIDDFHNGTNDKVYIHSIRREDYDDVIRWISPNILFSRMIQADQLP